MLLTSTTSYINNNLIPALAGLVEGGIILRAVIKITDGIEKGASLTEIFHSIENLLKAAAIGICIIAIVASLKGYFS